MKLPPRLVKVAEFIPPGKVVADIGTDHALLPLYLVEKGIASRVIAVEAGKKPFERAQEMLRSHPSGARVELRLGWGLKALEMGDGVDIVVIAGMGGGSIKEILSRKPKGLTGPDRYVLQPMSRPDQLRTWLPRGGFEIADESLVKDAGRIYQVYLVEPRREGAAGDAPFGARLLEKGDPLLEEYIAVKIKKTRIVLESLSRAGGEDVSALRQGFEEGLEKLERLMERVSQRR